jgi:spore germination protein KB
VKKEGRPLIPPDKEQISADQLSYLLLNYLIPSSLVFAVGIEIGPDAWLAGLLGIGISFGMMLFYLKLSTRFPGRTLIAINDTVWGPWLGKTCSAGFFLLYLYVTFIHINLTTSFQKEFLLDTPSLVLSLVASGISFLMVSYGLEVIARCSQLVIILFQIPFTLILTVLLIPELQLSNLQPLLQTPFPLILRAALRVGAFSFGTGFAYLMIFPLTRGREAGQIYPATVKAFAIGAGYHTLIITLITLALGPTAGYFTFPSLHTARLVNIGDVFSRMEVVAGIAIWLWNIFHQTMFAYNLATATGELLRLKSYRTLCLPLWILLSLLSVHSFASSIDDVEYASRVYQWLIFPFQYLLPLLTLLVAVIRKLPREKANK